MQIIEHKTYNALFQVAVTVCVLMAAGACAVGQTVQDRFSNVPVETLPSVAEIRQSLKLMKPAEKRTALLNLTHDPRRDVKILAIEQLKSWPAHEAISARATEMIASESDATVIGHAKLLASDQQARQSRPSSSVPPTATVPPTTTVPPIISVPPITSVPLMESKSKEAKTVTPRLLVPQTPFWMASSESDVGLPADVETDEKPDSSNRIRQPGILNRPIEIEVDEPEDLSNLLNQNIAPVAYEMDATLGFAGNSGVLPTEYQESDDFVPIEDRWRIGFPSWDRYGKDFPFGEDYPFKLGNILDPYNQNVLKGDYPILGQHTFFSLTATNLMINEYRQVPTPVTPFDSTAQPFSEPFFGDDNQYQFANYISLAFDLFHGNEAFKPMDWKIRINPVFNANHLGVGELAVVNPDVRRGKSRTRSDIALEEWYLEAKLADLGPDYDFMSVRAGSQLFVSDFRGFLFKDINRGVRLFGTRYANRDQFNIAWFDQAEKDTNSELNTFDDRHQNVTVANYFRQDFIFPGLTGEISFHYNHDQPSTRFDDNNFLVRPDPAGVFQEHRINAYYLGLATEGHIGRINIASQFYQAFGEDSLNPIAGEKQIINAQMAALETSYDRDWIRFRTSYFYASGDSNVGDSRATGFDTIFDDPIFAGGEFSYWQRQAIRLFGVNLVNRKSLVPNLRSSKTQGQSNFVNPGMHLMNFGMDFEIAPKLRTIANANYMFFNQTEPLRVFTFQNDIGTEIGADLSIGFEYRPFLNDNVIIVMGSSILLPGRGLNDLYGTEVPEVLQNLALQSTGKNLPDEIPSFNAHFLEMVLTY